MLTKLALLLLLIAIVFWGGRALARLGAGGRAADARKRTTRKRSEGARALAECPRCGAFAPAGQCDCGNTERAG